MQITGTGITSFEAKVLPDFRPLTRLALQWTQVASGNWVCVDRGAAGDVYETSVALYGTEATINNFIGEIRDNRVAGVHTITLTFNSTQNATEKIFGADVVYTSGITATVLEIDQRAQLTWKGFTLNLRLRALGPTFTGTPSIPDLKYLDIGWTGDSSYTINKFDSYEGTFSYIDSQSDIGNFTGVFTFTDAEMKALRRYIATQRSGSYTISAINGVSYPFGTRSPGSYPYTAKLIEWEDMGMHGVKWWRMKLVFAEVI